MIKTTYKQKTTAVYINNKFFKFTEVLNGLSII